MGIDWDVEVKVMTLRKFSEIGRGGGRAHYDALMSGQSVAASPGTARRGRRVRGGCRRWLRRGGSPSVAQTRVIGLPQTRACGALAGLGGVPGHGAVAPGSRGLAPSGGGAFRIPPPVPAVHRFRIRGSGLIRIGGRPGPGFVRIFTHKPRRSANLPTPLPLSPRSPPFPHMPDFVRILAGPVPDPPRKLLPIRPPGPVPDSGFLTRAAA
jgi:hypothetical protein